MHLHAFSDVGNQYQKCMQLFFAIILFKNTSMLMQGFYTTLYSLEIVQHLQQYLEKQ